jgi:hypothetical protein
MKGAVTNDTNNMTPSQYLETHKLTQELARLGVTAEQRQSMRFSSSNKRWPFDQWTVQWQGNIPSEAIPHVKAYCALKWLILEDPADSRDKQDAWRLVSETMVAPLVALGVRTKDAQSRRAKKPRGKVTSYGETLGQLIEKLALQRQYRNRSAKELWPHLFSVLNELERYPEDTRSHKPRRMRI